MTAEAHNGSDRRNSRTEAEAVFDSSRRQIAKSAQWLAGGVSSNFRAGMTPTPLVFERGDGAILYDIDGNALIDYYLAMGPMILGHIPEPVRQAAIEQLSRGILYGGQSHVEAEVAELFCHLVPCAERVRFAVSGSEVVQLALRLARAATGRKTILKFDGHYHGWIDNVLVSVAATAENAGPADAPARNPASIGQDADAWRNTEVLSWNDLGSVERRLAAGDVAAVLMEPAMCNSGGILPVAGYLEGVRAACTRYGTVLIFDEVITGFRVAPGGAQQLFGVTPDLATFAKCLGNGFPTAAVGGKAEIMDRVMSGVVHGGTYNTQAVAMAAALATLRELADGSVINGIDRQGRRLMSAIASALKAASIPATVTGFPQVFNVAFGPTVPGRNYRDLLAVDKARYIRFVHALLKRRVRVLERGTWFLSSCHDDDIIDRTIETVEAVASEV